MHCLVCNHWVILMQGMYFGPEAHGPESKYVTMFVHCKSMYSMVLVRHVSIPCSNRFRFGMCI